LLCFAIDYSEHANDSVLWDAKRQIEQRLGQVAGGNFGAVAGQKYGPPCSDHSSRDAVVYAHAQVLRYLFVHPFGGP